MKFAVLLVPAATVASFIDRSEYTFAQYLEDFGKSYSGEEHVERKALFEAELAQVNKHNEEYKAGKHTWWAAVNPMSDFLERERESLKTGKAVHHVNQHPFAHHLSSTKSVNPTRVDWREQNVVTPVKNQGGCGSCWAFSATEVVESHYMLATGEQNVKLAPQAYVNCVQNPQSCGGTGGCEGATMELAFNMTAQLGLPLESDLPYEGQDASCSTYKAHAICDGYYKVPVNDAKALETAIAAHGPVSVTVAANWFSYGGGIYKGGCTSTSCTLDHGVVAVGYDTNYWLVRNSWGSSWGESGYIRLSRDYDGDTFEDNNPASGVACKPYPEQQIVGGESGVLFDTSFPTNVRKATSTLTV